MSAVCNSYARLIAASTEPNVTQIPKPHGTDVLTLEVDRLTSVDAHGYFIFALTEISDGKETGNFIWEKWPSNVNEMPDSEVHTAEIFKRINEKWPMASSYKPTFVVNVKDQAGPEEAVRYETLKKDCLFEEVCKHAREDVS